MQTGGIHYKDFDRKHRPFSSLSIKIHSMYYDDLENTYFVTEKYFIATVNVRPQHIFI